MAPRQCMLLNVQLGGQLEGTGVVLEFCASLSQSMPSIVSKGPRSFSQWLYMCPCVCVCVCVPRGRHTWEYLGIYKKQFMCLCVNSYSAFCAQAHPYIYLLGHMSVCACMCAWVCMHAQAKFGWASLCWALPWAVGLLGGEFGFILAVPGRWH